MFLLGEDFGRKLGGSFSLGIRLLPLRGQRELSGFPARHSVEAGSLPLLSPSALACCFSTWSAQAAALANATASRVLHALESSQLQSLLPGSPALPIRDYSLNLRGIPSFSPQFPHPGTHCGKAPHTRGAEAVRWVTRVAGGRPKGAWGQSRVNRRLSSGSRKPLLRAGIA